MIDWYKTLIPQTVALSNEAMKRFVEVCNNPPEPTEALKRLMRESSRFIKEDSK